MKALIPDDESMKIELATKLAKYDISLLQYSRELEKDVIISIKRGSTKM